MEIAEFLENHFRCQHIEDLSKDLLQHLERSRNVITDIEPGGKADELDSTLSSAIAYVDGPLIISLIDMSGASKIFAGWSIGDASETRKKSEYATLGWSSLEAYKRFELSVRYVSEELWHISDNLWDFVPQTFKSIYERSIELCESIMQEKEAYDSSSVNINYDEFMLYKNNK